MKTKTLMHRLLLMIVLSVPFQIAIAQNGSPLWQKALGGDKDESAQDMDATSDGGVIVAGGTTSSNNGDVTANHGSRDYWIVKMDADGQVQWKKILGGNADDLAQAVRQSVDGGFIIAGTSGSTNGDVTGNHGSQDFWIVKLDNGGNLQWQKTYGGSGADVPYALDLTDDGGYVIAGETYSSNGDVTGNHSSGDYWIIKIDDTGNLQWQKTYGGSAFDFAHAIVHSRK
jgi:hypothetical protein